jgi:hypothetical protein
MFVDMTVVCYFLLEILSIVDLGLLVVAVILGEHIYIIALINVY